MPGLLVQKKRKETKRKMKDFIQTDREVISSIDSSPLFRRGDKFRIVHINEDPDLMPIEALHFRSRRIYGMEEEWLEDGV